MPARPELELSSRRLLHWGDLDTRRRRQAGKLGLLAWVARIALGAGLAALVARQAEVDPVLASRLILAALVVFYTFVMFGAPFRMYWRIDSPLLARLPIPGRALFDVALIRSLRASAAAAIVVVPAAAALALVPEVGRELALRHLALWGAVALASALLLPAVALGAGALVVGGKAQSLMSAVGGGEVAAPPSAWLGVLPGFASSWIVLAVIGSAGWVTGADETIVGPAAPLLGGIAAASLLAALAARAAAANVMPQAVREVAALDVQRLAHLEIHPPTAIERAVERFLAPGAALVHSKDARLLRRRFPMAFVAGAVTTLALWIVAAVGPDSPWIWATTLVAAFAAYGALMAHRLVTPPIELRYLATLPIAPADARRAKAAYLATYLVLYPVVGGLGLLVSRLLA